MSDCTWEPIENGVRCVRCGAVRSNPNLRRNCPTPLDCVHRGLVARAVRIEACNKKLVPISVRTCALFGECTVTVKVPGVDHLCRSCLQLKAPT